MSTCGLTTAEEEEEEEDETHEDRGSNTDSSCTANMVLVLSVLQLQSFLFSSERLFMFRCLSWRTRPRKSIVLITGFSHADPRAQTDHAGHAPQHNDQHAPQPSHIPQGLEAEMKPHLGASPTAPQSDGATSRPDLRPPHAPCRPTLPSNP